MSEPIPQHVGVIKFTGVTDWTGFLRKSRAWLVDHGYEFHEMAYKHAGKPTGKEEELSWHGRKKINSYCRWEVNITMKIWDMHPQKVIKDGNEVELEHVRARIIIDTICNVDYQNNFESTPFLRGMRNFLNKHIHKGRIYGGWTDDIYYENYKLHTYMKELLGMSTPTNSAKYRV